MVSLPYSLLRFIAKQFPQFSRNSESANLLRKLLLPHSRGGSLNQNSFSASRNAFWFLTLLKIKIPSSYIRTRGISRVTTLIRKLLAQLTSMSVRQHSSAFNVHQSVTAYLLNQSVQCTARGGISCGKVCHICVACMTRTNAIIGFLIAPQDNQPASPVGIP